MNHYFWEITEKEQFQSTDYIKIRKSRVNKRIPDCGKCMTGFVICAVGHYTLLCTDDLEVFIKVAEKSKEASDLHLNAEKMENALKRIQVFAKNLEFKSFSLKSGFYSLNLDISISEDKEDYIIYYKNQEGSFKTARTFIQRIGTLVTDYLFCPDKPWSEYNYISDQEYHTLKEFGKGKTEKKISYNIVELIEQAAEKNAERTAAVHKDGVLTYRELDRRANELADIILSRKEKKNPLIAIMIDRSLESLIAMEGILKAGAAFLPLDAKQPKDRVEYILRDSKAQMLIKTSSSNKLFTVEKKDTFITLGINFELLTGRDKPKINIKMNDLAYVIYTSGTTGKPKGVMVEHRNLSNFATWLADFGNMSNKTKMLHMFSIIFDASIIETFPCLISGGTIQILTEKEKTDPQFLLGALDHAQTLMIPSFFRALLDYAKATEQVEYLSRLDKLYFGAEALPGDLLEDIRNVLPDKLKDIFNLYGPTECTVAATACRFSEKSDLKNITIGKPIQNTDITIEKDEKICGIGVPGELVIGGLGVARGYVGNEKMTKEKFVSSENHGGQKAYRTGDIGFWLEDGTIKLLGRNDKQVKINGYRVELGEIEQGLRKIEGISDALVIYQKEEQQTFFSAFYIGESTLSEEEIKSKLKNNIPGYMIPKNIYRLEEFPLTVGGKLDRNKLIEEYKSMVAEDTSDLISTIFKNILGVDEFTPDDDFFELGGDSIKAIQIVSKLRQNRYDLKVRDILEERKIEQIFHKIREKDNPINYPQEEITGDFMLSPIQKVFFHKMRIHNPNYFNQSYMLETKEEVNISAVKYGLNQITHCHDLLRSVYDKSGQRILSFTADKHYGMNIYELKEDMVASEISDYILEKTGEIERSIDIGRGPLLKLGIFLGKQTSYLFFCIHHLSIDGISWRILIDDFLNSYHEYSCGREYKMPLKSISFKEWSEKLWDYAKSEKLRKEIKYWQSVNSKIASGKFAGQKITDTFSLNTMEVDMEQDYTQKLLYNISEAYHTEINDLLLSALSRAVGSVSKNRTVAINLEGHGRESIHKEAYNDRTVGWFTTEYPIIVENIGFSPEQDLINVKETIRAIPNRGMGYIILQNAYPELFEDIDPDITFNYLGEFGQEGNYGFTISEMTHAKDKDRVNAFRTPITINSMIVNKKFHLEITYEENIFSKEYVFNIMETFIMELRKIIDLCSESKEKVNTPSDFGEMEWSYSELASTVKKYKKEGKKICHINPLTSMQESMLYYKISEPDSSAYVVQLVIDVNRDISPDRMYQALDILAQRHGVLSANIIYHGVKVPRELILDGVKFERHVYDFSMENDAGRCIHKLKEEDIRKGFDLENDTLLRMTVCKMKQNTKVFLTFHHILLDGWSSMLLIDELFSVYLSLEKGKTCEIQKRDNVQGEYGKYLKQCDKERAKEFWSGLLSGYTEQCGIRALDAPKQGEKDEVGRTAKQLPSGLKTTAEKFASQYKITLNTVIETVWAFILRAYTRKEDIVFGKVVSGRNGNIEDIGKALGMYINTVPVRVQFHKNQTILDLLQEVQKQSIAVNDYDYYPLEEIQQMTAWKGELFSTAVSFENYQVDEEKFYKVDQVRELTTFAISLGVQSGQELQFNLLYDIQKYGRKEMALLLERTADMLQQVVTNPYLKITDLNMAVSEEAKKILGDFNHTDRPYPLQSNIVDLFEKQVIETPDNIAVQFHNEILTYRELDEAASALAWKITKHSIGENKIVPIITTPSAKMAIAIFAVLKAGAAYLPVDPKQPLERIRYMLTETKAKTIICGCIDSEKTYTGEGYTVIHMDDAKESTSQRCNRSIQADDKAYVIFTSGTTGMPKGVLVSHRNLINHTMWQIENSKYNEHTKMVQTIAFTFDGHASEVFPVLLSGGTLLIADETQRKDPKELLPLLKGNRMTLIPSLLRELILYAGETGQIEKLREFEKLYIAAEPISREEILHMLEEHEERMEDIYHFYGPTEATITTVCQKLSEVKKDGILPIGKPIANTRAYVLNETNKLCGIGIPGELYIGGDSVTEGYLNNRELTGKKFVEKKEIEDKPLYATGDIVCWNTDGTIQFLGRKDEQIKLRGFRIEIEEIVSNLRKCKEVADAAVSVQKVNQEDALCAYIVKREEAAIENIREQVSKFLPDYMIPQYYIFMDKLPTNLNGKVDKKSLPTPNITKEREKNNQEPQTATQKKVAKLFSDVLEVKEIGIEESFYELGGHSLKLMRLLNKIEQEFGKRLAMKEVMEGKTVKNISRLIDNRNLEENMAQDDMLAAVPLE